MSSKFKVNAKAGTVTDVTTGLTWQRKAPVKRMTWEQAKTYAATLNLDGGGWRLPTREELTSLIDCTRCNPAIDVESFPNCPNDWFWTDTPHSESPFFKWIVYFYNGHHYIGDTAYSDRVRCVRGSASSS